MSVYVYNVKIMVKTLEKISSLERDVASLKRFVGLSRRTDARIDARNYRTFRDVLKRVRLELIRQRYPKLYARIAR